MATTKRILIIAGGTGGHVFPGLALACELQLRGHEIHWLGTPAGIESRLVPAADIPLHLISVKGIRGKGIKAILLAPLNIVRAIWQSVVIIRRLKCDLVVGLGGFVSGPGGVAAKLCARPLVIHEQNAVAGTTNRLLARIADCVLSAFPSVLGKAICIGNPVRTNFFSHGQPQVEQRSTINILVVGGSRGARSLNQLLPAALQYLVGSAQVKEIAIYHQTGDKLLAETEQAYKDAGVELDSCEMEQLSGGKVSITPFIDNIAESYRWADLVICRAGALTVSELAASGVASLLVPFPFAIDDHQTANGHFLVKAEAALMWQQKDLTAKALAKTLGGFIDNPVVLTNMGKNAATCSKPNAAVDFADACENIFKKTEVNRVLL